MKALPTLLILTAIASGCASRDPTLELGVTHVFTRPDDTIYRGTNILHVTDEQGIWMRRTTADALFKRRFGK